MNRIQPYRKEDFSLKSRWQSIGYAWQGIRFFFRREHNARVHLAGTFTVIILSLLLGVNRTEAMLLVVVTGLVWMAELFNTAIERIMDMITDKRSAAVKCIKDVAAAGVLVAAITALLTGGLVFVPKIIAL